MAHGQLERDSPTKNQTKTQNQKPAFAQNDGSWGMFAGCRRRKSRKHGIWVVNVLLRDLHTTLIGKDFDPLNKCTSRRKMVFITTEEWNHGGKSVPKNAELPIF